MPFGLFSAFGFGRHRDLDRLTYRSDSRAVAKRRASNRRARTARRRNRR
jgi:hypothetical protein